MTDLNGEHIGFSKSIKDEDANVWIDNFYFIQGADSQFGMIANFIKKLPEPEWQEEIELSERLMIACNRLEPKPKFMVVCGDIVDAFPGDHVRREQMKDFKRIFAKLQDIPLVCLCGNHDIGNEPTMEGLMEYKKDFGPDYFYFITGGILFIVMNTQFFKHRLNMEEYAKEQDDWLDRMLARSKDFKHAIIFGHIPWFLQEPDEEDDYFNIDKETRLKWLKKFKQAGIRKLMCGHYHRNAGGWFEDMELVVTSAIGAQCGNDKSGVRLVRVREDSIDHKYYAIEDVPAKIDLEAKSLP